MPNSNENTLQETERTVLAVLLNDSHAIMRVMEILPEPDVFLTPGYGTIYHAILALTKELTPPNVYTVADRLGWKVEALQEVAKGFNTQVSKQVLYLADIVAREAKWRKVQAAARAVAQMAEERPSDDMDGFAFTAMQLIGDTTSAATSRDPSVTAVGEALDEEIKLYESGATGVTTGMDWLDDKTLGILPGTVWVVSAPYKGRKTSLARNMALAALKSQQSVDWYALEGNRTGTYAGFLAMLATDRLIAWGKPDECFLSETFILRGMRSEAQADAIAEARRELDGFKLRIYDGKDKVHSADAVASKVKRNAMLFGTSLFVVDYVQLMGAGKLFERMEEAAHVLPQTIQQTGVAGILLTQLNEATIYSENDDETEDANYSPGVKGGGDIPAAADFLLKTRYRSREPNVIKVRLKLARHAQPGWALHQINPQSGRILRMIEQGD
jgi:replicative DNA helicase